MFGFSVSRVAHIANLHTAASYRQDLAELDDLTAALDGIRSQLADLQDDQLTKRTGWEIRDALLDYTNALHQSLHQLRKICQSRQQEKEKDGKQGRYSIKGYREERIAYDDAIQHHKRLGERLTNLLSTF